MTKLVTPEMICDEVDCIGFGCELLTLTEISHELTTAKRRQKFQNLENNSN